jgi:hypothetical protein
MNALYDLTSITPTVHNLSQTPTAASITPSQTDTPTLTPSITPTTTLMPLPAITLVFPAPTNTSRVVITPEPVLRTQTSNPTEESTQSNVSPRLKAITIALVLLWIILAAFVIIYIRQFK